MKLFQWGFYPIALHEKLEFKGSKALQIPRHTQIQMLEFYNVLAL